MASQSCRRGRPARSGTVSGVDLSSICVDADGVPAEWVEVTTATPDQWTFVCFCGGPDPSSAIEGGWAAAAEIALATGARVLVVGCRSTSRGVSSAVEDGLSAYRWLLGEGCETALTAFVTLAEIDTVAPAVLLAASDDGLPVPGGGIRRGDDGTHRKCQATFVTPDGIG